ncbi:MAG: hypothetical protein HY447_02385 [Candidatus Omnitrophica bacterium]|nr:hypothetical protein [Candidatus Omnitrophota bacterium]
MKANKSSPNEMLDYVIQDFLELKASLEGDKVRQIKEFLLSQDTDHAVVTPIEGFQLARQLVLVVQGSQRALKRLILVGSEDGKVEIKNLS